MNFENNQQKHEIEKSILEKYPIKLLEERNIITIEEIQEMFGKDEPVFVCDFYLNDIEKKPGVDVETWGLNYKNIVNIDHHAPIEKMQHFISSTPLAIEFIKEYGAQPKSTIVINHTDCDSVLSSAIIKGVIQPEDKFAQAAITADHTGEANNIADLLEALRNKRDYNFSITNLGILLQGKPLNDEANQLLNKFNQDRLRASEIVASGKFKSVGPITYALLEEKINSVFLPSLLPDSTIIVIASPFKDEAGNDVLGKLNVKIRLGKKTIENLTLHELNLDTTAINFGGPWNAGSNQRSGGTNLSVEECVEIIKTKLSEFLAKKR